VQRNRAKRLLREAFRLNQHLLPAACDVVLIARAPILALSGAEAQAAFRSAVERLARRLTPKDRA
jgi:ribonuclease P protein component